jgi:hypothetical protein
MTDTESSTPTADPASRQQVIADLIAPYSVTKPEAAPTPEGPAIPH